MGISSMELLVSTMFADKDLLEKLNVQSDAVIVNQCDNEGKETFSFRGHAILWIDTKTRGLSVSRNIALDNAKSEYVVLTDDDMRYVDGYPDIIKSAFQSYPDADIIEFQLNGIDTVFKKYSQKGSKIGFLSSMHLCSAELAIKREKVAQNRIRFEECFGSGAKYKMGEENIFLFNCLKKGLKIFYYPEATADIFVGESTWFKGYDGKYFFDRGASYYEMFGCLSKIMVAQFLLRKRRLFKGISLSDAWKSAKKGINERKRERQ